MGQAIVGVVQSSTVVHTGAIPCMTVAASIPTQLGDMDVDGDVDVFDYPLFRSCLTGPGGGPIGAECVAGDFDFDDDVDLLDFGGFQDAFGVVARSGNQR